MNSLDIFVLEIAHFIAEKRCTVREAAVVFCVSKSCVHNYVTKRLARLDLVLFARVEEVLKHNFDVKHLRGGASTKRMWQSGKSRVMQGDRQGPIQGL